MTDNSIMPFTAARQLVVAVPADGSTASQIFTTAGATAQELGVDTAFMQNDGIATAFVTFTAGVVAVPPGGVVSSNSTIGQPILAGMGMTLLIPPLATYVNASSNVGVATVLRVSLGKGQ